MITNIIIPHSLILQEKVKIKDYLWNKLIEQQKIDTNYYDITINQMTCFDLALKSEKVVYIEYDLERKPCWNDLEECEERLKIGL